MADWHDGDTLLEITEHRTVLAEEELLRAFPQDVWTTLGLRVQRRLGAAPDIWEVTADRYVGVAQLRGQAGRAQLRIHPKIDADIFFLADYAFGAERDLLADQHLRAELAALRPDPAACLLAWYLAELEAFVRRWLRRDYVLRREVFDGKVRGRLLVADYMRSYLAQGQAHEAPCQLFDLTPNNLPNQILKAALRRVARLGTGVPVSAARRALRRRVERLLPAFAGITDRTVLPGDYNRLRLSGALRHYAPMMAKSRAMLEGMYLSESVGQHVQDAFLWDMSVLYEEALRGVLASWDAGTLDSKRWSARIFDPLGVRLASSRVKPDYVITTSAGKLVLDAKYKDVLRHVEDEEAEIEVARTRIRVGRADIYQAVSYSRHEGYAPATPALVYPVALAAGESLPKPCRVEGFEQNVYLCFFDTGPLARENLPAFLESLEAVAGLDVPSAA